MNKPWKILIVDDDEGIHSITRMVFRGYEFENRPIELINALSGSKAKKILCEQNDIAVTILDVVMETDQEGLNLVNFIRDDLNNKDIRIILRTGHPGFAPEAEVVIQYDINDYLSKAELSASRLLTSVVVALRSFRDIQSVKPKAKTALLTTSLATEQITEPLLLEGLSQYLATKIVPLLAQSSKLAQLSHKPMVADLISQLKGHCEQLSVINFLLQPISQVTATKVNIDDQLNLLVSRYLPQAKHENWIIDYEVNEQLASSIDIDIHWFNTLLITLLEIAMCRFDKSSDTQLLIHIGKCEADTNKLSIKFLGHANQKVIHPPWQTILLLQLDQLANFYDGQIDTNAALSKTQASCLIEYTLSI